MKTTRFSLIALIILFATFAMGRHTLKAKKFTKSLRTKSKKAPSN